MQQDEQLLHLKQQSQDKPLSRRDFVRALSIATAAGPGLITAGLSGFALTRHQRVEAAELVVEGLGKLPKVQLGKRMGKMEVARIIFCQDNSEDLIVPALQAGMNFIHKAGYWGARRPLPDEIKKLPRESYYTDITVDNTPRNPDDEEGAYRQVTSSLEANGLKYYDIFRAHFGWHTLDAFNKGDNASYRAFKRLKREGKVKYFGVSQHAAPRENYETYMTMIQAQIDSGLIDSIQLWCSYASTPEELEIFAKAHKSGIGMTAMKAYAHGNGKMRSDVAKQEELKAPNMIGRSCLRYVLGMKDKDGKTFIDCAVTSLHNMDVFEENVGSMATKVTMRDGFETHTA